MEEQTNQILSKAEQTLQQIQTITNLPAVPKVLQEISQLFNLPRISLKQVGNIVEKDPALTVKVLSVANSPLYGLRRNVKSIDSAVLILGIQEIKSIVTSIKMTSTIKMKPDKFFDPNKFWHHSMSVGMLAQRMAKDLGFSFEGDCFVAGMLHDMGILVMHEFLSKDFNLIKDETKSNNCSFLEKEYEVLGLSHQEIGEFLTQKWALPPVYSDALRFHHRPGDSKENNFLTSILHIADFAISQFHINGVVWDENYALDDSVIELLNFLSKENFVEFIETYRDDSIEAAKSPII
ncbi:MAG: HDOD domain-containing protein [Ignavibacteriaceae bacterium]|nr:HDOD domain-containing protein [Ignavibacteriaceae bacterium]